MAYRLPTERRESSTAPNATSYLDDFLDHIESLPSTTKSLFHQIRQLDDRIATTVQESSAASKEAVTRATTKGVPLENVKRTFHDFVHLQASAAEFADKKVRLAADARDRVAAAVADLDARLVDFEAQLRKEGRWPAAEAPKSGLSAKVPRSKSPAVAKPERQPSRSPPPDPPAPPPRATQKARKRESASIGVAKPTTPRAAALAAARAAEAAQAAAAAAAAEAAAQAEKDAQGDVIMDAAEQAALDSTLYCICRNVSHGEMVGCEGKNCEIEWFHFKCVGLTEEPEGAWYCKDCAASMRRKSTNGRRKAPL